MQNDYEKIVHDYHFANKCNVTGSQSSFSVNIEPPPIIRTIPLNSHTQKVDKYFTNLPILSATDRARGSISYNNSENNSRVIISTYFIVIQNIWESYFCL